MPLLRNWRRARAMRMRMANLKRRGRGRYSRRTFEFVAPSGTGYRHPAVRWARSLYHHQTHKMVIPAENPDKKFILVLGDCHLRALVEGHVQMPEGELSFGFMSVTKASAADLRVHVRHSALPRTPDVVCVLAPGVHLSNKMQIKTLGVEFGSLLISVCSCWPKVFVLDFPPTLQIRVSKQELYRKEFRKVATQMGISYVPIAEHFPLDRLELWSRDGVHLSDSDGMPILAKVLWDVTCIQVESPWPEITLPADLDESCDVKEKADQQEGGVVLKDCSVQCSYVLQDYMSDDISQASAPSSTADLKGPRRSARLHHQSLVAPKEKAIKKQVKATASQSSAPVSFSPAVAVKEEIATPFSVQPLEHIWKGCASNLWSWDLNEQQPISDEEEFEAGLIEFETGPVEFETGLVGFEAAPVEFETGLVGFEAAPVEFEAGPVEFEAAPVGFEAAPVEFEAAPVELKAGPVELKAGPVDGTNVSAAGNHMAHVMNFTIDDMEVQVKIEEETEDNLRVTPTMQEDFFSRDRQLLPAEVKNFQEKLSVTEGNNFGLQADFQMMIYQLQQRDREIFSLQNKLCTLDKHYHAMEEKWQKEISRLKALLSEKEKEMRIVKRKIQTESRAHLNALDQLDDLKFALERSKLTRKSLEEQLRQKLAEKKETHKKELKEKEESLRDRIARASKRELSILSENWESKAQKWHKKKAELEETMFFKEKNWKQEKANLQESIEHLKRQNNRLQRLVKERKSSGASEAAGLMSEDEPSSALLTSSSSTTLNLTPPPFPTLEPTPTTPTTLTTLTTVTLFPFPSLTHAE